MDWDLIEQKLESLRRCIGRVRERCPESAAILSRDYDAQDILALNLTRAVQLCVDIAIVTDNRTSSCRGTLLARARK
jgi:hypothetical protein